MKSQHQPLVSGALAAALALGLAAAAGPAGAAENPKEKCYGVAKAGQNDCANLSGTHSCAGLSKADMAPDDWKYVDKGTCKAAGGLSAAEAKAKMKK